MVNIGNRPTVHSDGEICIEAHLFDFSGNLYEQYIEIQFIARLRSEKKMNGLKELTDQLQKDKEHAMNILLNSSISILSGLFQLTFITANLFHVPCINLKRLSAVNAM